MTYINQSLKNLLNPNSKDQSVASDILLNIYRELRHFVPQLSLRFNFFLSDRTL